MTLAVVSRTIASVVCSALLLIVVLQMRRDALSRAFALLVLVLGATALSALALRVISIVGGDITFAFRVGSFWTATLPFAFTLFVAQYFNVQTPVQRLCTGVYLLFIPVVGWLDFSGMLTFGAEITRDGLLSYHLTPLGQLAIALGVAGQAIGLLTAWGYYLHRAEKRNPWDARILAGITVVGLGSASIIVPILTRYTVEQISYAVGALVLAPPVMRQGLFDPIAQLNRRLERRADQLAAITRVGQQASSTLNHTDLLNRTAAQICESFDCYAVAIYVPENQHLIVRAAAGTAAEAFVASADGRPFDDSAHHAVRVADLPRELPERLHALHPLARSLVSLPLFAAAPNGKADDTALIGVLDIKSERVGAFSEDDMEALHILANQVAIAMRNAELFEQVQQSDRYKTRFIHFISHELRSPLQTIIGHLTFLAHPQDYAGTVLSHDYVRDVRIADQSARHLHALLDGILDMAKIEAGQIELQYESVDPVALLEDVAHTFTATLRPDVELVKAYPTTLPHVTTDDLRLKQVLGNLISNACKYTKAGYVILDARVEDGLFCFSVKDTGPGIPEDEQRKLFASFNRANQRALRSSDGAGLGLSISRQLAKLLGGDVWFESIEGQGSTFFCSIPLAGDALRPDEQAPTARSRATVLTRHAPLPRQVIVVGIDLDRQAYMHTEPLDFRAFSAASLDDALSFAHVVRPDCFVHVRQVGEPSQLASIADARLAGIPVIDCTPHHWEEELSAWFRSTSVGGM